MITNYLVLHSTNLDELLSKVNGASEIGYHIVASGSYGAHYPGYVGATAYLNPPLSEPLTHYVWMERYLPWGGRYTTVGPGVVVENVLGRPIAYAAGSYPPAYPAASYPAEVVRGAVIEGGVVAPGMVQPVARGVIGEPMAGFIKLTTSDAPDTPFYVRPERITAMYPNVAEGHTVINYDAPTGATSWTVKETPDQILELARHPLYEKVTGVPLP